MGMFFRYKGFLEFETEAEAKRHFDILTGEDDSWFLGVPKELELDQGTIRFQANGNFNSYLSCEKTKDLIYEAARSAIKGRVNVDEGDDEDKIWNMEFIPASGKPKNTSME
jgi:hypothetical protein